MKDKSKQFGPDVPNYALLNAQQEQQQPKRTKRTDKEKGKPGQSQPDATKPK